MKTDLALDAFAALSHPVRLAVFKTLVRHAPDSLPAGQLAAIADTLPSTLSAHLAKLLAAGLVTRSRHAREVRYGLNADGARALVDYLVADCCGGRPELCGTVRPALEPCR